MASIRTARTLAVLASVPLCLGLAGGVAHAFADTEVDTTNAWASGNLGSLGSGVVGANDGNVATTQQSAIGSGASNESNTAGIADSPFAAIDQSDRTYTIVFGFDW
ncbi:hypothetical protein [Streptomyces radicis]|uniref:Secreted protein n=1 Tax=Streptomyces radicis TaxID=1750517 RepID=A0A3A9W244_9ACTN|nr:hypothetical protein [Streptomyces radicis]RKN07218.1 hypothetical protein D7319_19250 [Streptomyces radicis]RKN26764.1 hypothetical protein D7318_05300 [Streptomyces radicis]